MATLRSTTRRSLFAGALLPALALAAPALASHGDQEWAHLSACLDSLSAEKRSLNARKGVTDEELDAWQARGDPVLDRIIAKPATTMEGFRVKAKAIAYCHSGEPIELDDQRTCDMRIAESIIADLLKAG